MYIITRYVNLYHQGWFHRAGKPGNVDIHAGDLYETEEAAKAHIDPVILYIATVPVQIPTEGGLPAMTNPPDSVPVSLKSSRDRHRHVAGLLLLALKGARDAHPRGHETGLCSITTDLVRSRPANSKFVKEVKEMRQRLFQQWPGYSGMPEYPVPSPFAGEHPREAYYKRPRWEGEYGDLRRDLLRWTIDTLETWLEENR